MKVLIYYTSHRQFEEIKISSELLNNTSELRNFDLIFHCNNLKLNIFKYFKRFPNKNKELIHTSKSIGYRYGPYEAIADNFEKMKNYDYVIHLHPDVFIINEDKILKILNEYKNKKKFLSAIKAYLILHFCPLIFLFSSQSC